MFLYSTINLVMKVTTIAIMKVYKRLSTRSGKK